MEENGTYIPVCDYREFLNWIEGYKDSDIEKYISASERERKRHICCKELVNYALEDILILSYTCHLKVLNLSKSDDTLFALVDALIGQAPNPNLTMRSLREWMH